MQHQLDHYQKVVLLLNINIIFIFYILFKHRIHSSPTYISSFLSYIIISFYSIIHKNSYITDVLHLFLGVFIIYSSLFARDKDVMLYVIYLLSVIITTYYLYDTCLLNEVIKEKIITRIKWINWDLIYKILLFIVSLRFFYITN